MRKRLLIVIACVVCLFIAASWTPAAQSQSAPGTATTSQTADTADAADPSAPEIVVDIPDDAVANGDEADDGIDQSLPAPKPAPTPTPTPAPTPSAPIVPSAPVVPEPEPVPSEPAPAPTPTPDDTKNDKPAEQPKPEPKVVWQPVAPPPTPRVDTVLPTTGGAARSPEEVARALAAGDDGDKSPYDKLKPYQPAAHASEVLAITGGGAATLAAIAAGLGAGAAGRRRMGRATARARTDVVAGGGDGGGDDGGDDGGWLEGVEIEGENAGRFGRGWGDRSRTWQWRITDRVDRFSTSWPDRFAKISPVISRVSIDGDYLRAMLGGAYALLFPMAAGIGVLAAASADWVALPPTLGFFVAILALGVLDSMLGYTAALTYALAILVAGNLDSAAAVREVSGLILIWFAMPLSAAAVRPLRRNLNLRIDGIWDRSADLALGGLFASWIASNQVSALGPLGGYELPIANDRWTIGLVVLGLVGVRILLETAAAHFYPKRLVAVEAHGELEPPRLQEGISLCIQIAVLMLITSSWMGWNWALIVGSLLFFVPLVPWLFIEKVPYSAFIAKWMPAGLLKWAWVIVGTVVLTKVLDTYITDPEDSINWGYIILPLPILLVWALELFAENEPEEEEEEEAAEDEAEASGDDDEEEEDEGRFPMTWPMRVAGVPILALCVYLVYFVIG